VLLLGLDDPAVKLPPGVAPFNVPLPIPYESRVNGRLLRPVLALAAFLAWKAVRALVERRRRPSAASE
jgi:hypothetical protein